MKTQGLDSRNGCAWMWLEVLAHAWSNHTFPHSKENANILRWLIPRRRFRNRAANVDRFAFIASIFFNRSGTYLRIWPIVCCESYAMTWWIGTKQVHQAEREEEEKRPSMYKEHLKTGKLKSSFANSARLMKVHPWPEKRHRRLLPANQPWIPKLRNMRPQSWRHHCWQRFR